MSVNIYLHVFLLTVHSSIDQREWSHWPDCHCPTIQWAAAFISTQPKPWFCQTHRLLCVELVKLRPRLKYIYFWLWMSFWYCAEYHITVVKYIWSAWKMHDIFPLIVYLHDVQWYTTYCYLNIINVITVYNVWDTNNILVWPTWIRPLLIWYVNMVNTPMYLKNSSI